MRKTICLFTAILLIVGFFTACDPTGKDPLHAELRLVPLTTGDMGKAISDKEGQMYLPLSEVNSILAKHAAADIDFGEVKATKTLQYVLMNVGNTDVYDITFEAGDLVIYPSHIGLIPTPEEGGDLVALPIVSVIKEHVIPLDGVGSLLDMETGAFNDMLSLSYNYNIADTAGVDTFDITDEYTVEGIKKGAFMDIYLSGVHITDYVYNAEQITVNGFLEPVPSIGTFRTSQMDSITVENNGNTPMQVRILNSYLMEYGSVLDTVLHEGESIEIGGLLRGGVWVQDAGSYEGTLLNGNILLFGAMVDQPYVFEAYGKLWVEGYCVMAFNEDYDPSY
jgi:hypothetical protein